MWNIKKHSSGISNILNEQGRAEELVLSRNINIASEEGEGETCWSKKQQEMVIGKGKFYLPLRHAGEFGGTGNLWGVTDTGEGFGVGILYTQNFIHTYLCNFAVHGEYEKNQVDQKYSKIVFRLLSFYNLEGETNLSVLRVFYWLLSLSPIPGGAEKIIWGVVDQIPWSPE